MLIKITDHLKKDKTLSKPWRGTVVQNHDPKKLGRIKVRVPSLLEEEDVEKLPWVYPWVSPGSGRDDSGFLCIPDLDTEVFVEFPYNNIYAGVYTGSLTSEETRTGLFDENYPFSYGFRDRENTYFRVDRFKKDAEFHHTSGAQVRMLKDSTIELSSSKGIRFVSGDKKTEIFLDLASGVINLVPREEQRLSGNVVTIDPKDLQITVGKIDENVSGAKESNITGGKKTNIGGSDSKTVTGNSSSVIGGSDSQMIADNQDVTIGTGHKETIALGDYDQTLMLGDHKITIMAGNFKHHTNVGNIDYTTLAGNVNVKTTAGNATFGTDLGNVEVSTKAGNVDVKTAMGNASLQTAVGMVNISNTMCAMTFDPVGNVIIQNPGGATITMLPTGNMTVVAPMGLLLKGIAGTLAL